MVDKPNTKIAVSDIDKLEELLDQAPAHRDSVVSKRQAIGRLAPKLYAMRAKGYSWNAIAAWLTSHGLEVTTAVLSGYLRRAPTADRAVRRRAGRPDPQRASVAPTAASSVARGEQGPASRAAPAERTLATSPSANREANGRRVEPSVRRSEFPVRPDSEEI